MTRQAPSVTIASSRLTAAIAPLGAELQALQDAGRRDLLWDGDPTFWKGRAPLLFPIVGRLPDDTLRSGGRAYAMKQHGLARISVFTLMSEAPDSCEWQLEADAETRKHYPHDFVLRVRYGVAESTLSIVAQVENRGEAPMPVSFGFHPAFRWPLPGGGAKSEHRVTFAADEAARVRRLDGGLLKPQPEPSPVNGRTLMLDERLFAADAIVFDQLKSHSVTYAGAAGPALRVDFPGMPNLGLWSKPGAGFLCIEPWQGYAAPVGFAGDFSEKPGLVSIARGASREFAMSVTVMEGAG